MTNNTGQCHHDKTNSYFVKNMNNFQMKNHLSSCQGTSPRNLDHLLTYYLSLHPLNRIFSRGSTDNSHGGD